MVTKWLDNRLFHPPCNFSVMVQSTQGLVRSIHRPLKYETRVFDQGEEGTCSEMWEHTKSSISYPCGHYQFTDNISVNSRSNGVGGLVIWTVNFTYTLSSKSVSVWCENRLPSDRQAVKSNLLFSSGHFTGVVSQATLWSGDEKSVCMSDVW